VCDKYVHQIDITNDHTPIQTDHAKEKKRDICEYLF